MRAAAVLTKLLLWRVVRGGHIHEGIHGSLGDRSDAVSNLRPSMDAAADSGFCSHLDCGRFEQRLIRFPPVVP